jgi:hypothetical protein
MGMFKGGQTTPLGYVQKPTVDIEGLVVRRLSVPFTNHKSGRPYAITLAPR